MRAAEFYRAVTMDRTDLLERLLSLFEREGIRYCIIGGLAVNAYVEPLVSLDLDVVVAPDQISRVEALLAEEFEVAEFPHCLNVSDPDSSLRVQIQKDDRYGSFVGRSQIRDVLGHEMRVVGRGCAAKKDLGSERSGSTREQAQERPSGYRTDRRSVSAFA